MKNKLMIFGLLALPLLVITGMTFAYKGDVTKMNPSPDAERYEQVTKAFEVKNYESFKKLFAKKPMLSKVDSEEKFNIFAEMHKAKVEGNDEKV